MGSLRSLLGFPSSSLSQFGADESSVEVPSDISSWTGESDWEEEFVTVVTDMPAVSRPRLHGFVFCDDVMVAVVTVWVVVVTLVKPDSKLISPVQACDKPILDSDLTRL